MVDSVTPAMPDAASIREAAAALPAVRSAARWFWWIAGLSVVNTVMFQSGSDTSFVMGLGITAVSDAVFAANRSVGFVIDAIVLGFFVLVGLKAQHGSLWAFYLGTAVYALDALIYVLAQDWMPVAFHGLAIFFILKGIGALRSAMQAAAAPG
ncbi:MAG TPA: hypothetical protein VKB34_14255 [Povalibacter sp.]|nr:hypothetical protein [Povalibacter sp.]